ncbi:MULTISPECIES: FCD domain-containing protein [unclassified Rathayibacter]|uniref:FadR/GntR family transcriptional regulator n=1 Tax=unclassified Rathayibacter TaxID=2609250 RepID=UPI0010479165|nr:MULTISPECIES: FCD domain-containing protein [unclassified Rathayibacter]TCL81745.1 DNA-binding FadR family transcriptional regulator [Rathayibacter sp. PhB192]TCM26754.1 DNA-binding FadR family transcriptional regulator [Rathayibacter sp. PhB179]
MPRPSLVATVADALLDEIVAGRIPIGSELPSEGELALAHDVSRATMREALGRLQGLNVIDARRGKRGTVNPVARWSDLEPILRATASGVDSAAASLHLIEVREMIETGASALAAVRRSDADLARLEEELARMTAAHESGDLAGFVAADIAFHDVILAATGNVFVAAVFAPLAKVMRAKREQTSALVQIQRNALVKHRAVLEAIRAADADASRAAMADHIAQTAEDLRRYVLSGDDSSGPDIDSARAARA